MENIEVLKNFIIKSMTEGCYMYGEDKDYYFGETPWNDNLTVFYNDSVNDIESKIYHTIRYDFSKLLKSQYESDVCYFEETKENNAFGIHLKTLTNNHFGIKINLMIKGELEEKIKQEPERWQFYLDNVKNKEENDE